MHAIIGLGNPGSEYDGTRHNLGFSVIDALCGELKTRLAPESDDYLLGTAAVAGKKFCLVKPLTYMNNSGRAVSAVRARYDVSLGNMLVVCDDFQLPLGRIRVRLRGSDGGHNGLYSIISHLQTDEFPRLRCGIASHRMPGKKSEMARFVLSPFDKDETQVVNEMIARARDASLTVVREGIEAAMNRFNPSPQDPGDA